MTIAELAQQDQADAAEREFNRKAQRGAMVFLAVFAALALYCLLAVYGIVPAAPWSPLGKP